MSTASEPIFKHCPVGCNSSLENTDIELAEGMLKKCPACGQLLSSCSKIWFDESMQEFDVPEGTLPTGKNKQRYHQRMGKILNKAKALQSGSSSSSSTQNKSPRLLDVGCSSGALLRVAKESGFDACGAEPATQAADTARSLGFDVFPGFLHDAHFPDNHFDVITLFEVIEHLLDPQDLLNEILRILKPGGVLLIGTGNADSWTVGFMGADWEYFDIRSHGGHISFFNPKSMRMLTQTCGFDVESINTKRVNIRERKNTSKAMYEVVKVSREALAIPARWADKGHDMLATLKKPEQ